LSIQQQQQQQCQQVVLTSLRVDTVFSSDCNVSSFTADSNDDDDDDNVCNAGIDSVHLTDSFCYSDKPQLTSYQNPNA